MKTKKFLGTLLVLQLIVAILAAQHSFGDPPSVFSLAYSYKLWVQYSVGGIIIVFALLSAFNVAAGKELTAFGYVVYIVLWSALTFVANSYENPTGTANTGQRSAEERVGGFFNKAEDMYHRGIPISPNEGFSQDVEDATGIDIRGRKIPPPVRWWWPALIVVLGTTIMRWLGMKPRKALAGAAFGKGSRKGLWYPVLFMVLLMALCFGIYWLWEVWGLGYRFAKWFNTTPKSFWVALLLILSTAGAAWVIWAGQRASKK